MPMSIDQSPPHTPGTQTGDQTARFPSAPLGLLFDLDGTMADTDRYHFEAFNTLLAEHGRALTLEHFKAKIMGGANAAIMAELFPELDRERHAVLADRKEAMFRHASAGIEAIAGLHDILAWARTNQVPVGAVTNAPRLNAEHMLACLGLEHLIAGVVVGEELPRSKPDPLPYLTGAERLGLPPDRLIAFEDSRTGVRSAVAAGMVTVGLTTGLDAEALREVGATLAIDDYRDPALRRMLEAARARD